MGRAAARRYEEKDEFEEGHMPLVWDELHDRFGVNTKKWREKFETEFLQQPHAVGKVEFFRRFMNENFNGTINHLLCRHPIQGTMNALMDYVAKRRIR
jgi:hypothetical protein